MNPKLAVVIPAYNEAECIADVVRKWDAFLCPRFPSPGELVIILVNDGSRDNTGAILDGLAVGNPRLRVVHQSNAGHGRAVVHGYSEAVKLRAEWVFQTDSDDQFVPEDFPKLWEERERSNFILGYRKIRYDALPRLVITRIVRLMLFTLYGARIKDSNIPYRLINGEYLARLLNAIPEPLFAPNIFLSVLAYRDGQDPIAIPVVHKDRATGTVSIVKWRLIKVCLRSARELAQFRLSLGHRLRVLRQAGGRG
jgi:dolichol-phosphate mannosyltransferase